MHLQYYLNHVIKLYVRNVILAAFSPSQHWRTLHLFCLSVILHLFQSLWIPSHCCLSKTLPLCFCEFVFFYFCCVLAAFASFFLFAVIFLSSSLSCLTLPVVYLSSWLLTACCTNIHSLTGTKLYLCPNNEIPKQQLAENLANLKMVCSVNLKTFEDTGQTEDKWKSGKPKTLATAGEQYLQVTSSRNGTGPDGSFVMS